MISTVIATTVSLVGLYGVAAWLYRDYRVDRFRQSLFELRGELFDFAADGHIGFDHPAYRGLRELINRHIRFGHRIRMLPGVLFASSLTEAEREWLDAHSFDTWWDESTNDLSVPTARTLYGVRHRVDHQLQMELILGSPLLTFTLVPAIALIVATWLPMRLPRHGMARLVESFELAGSELGRAT